MAIELRAPTSADVPPLIALQAAEAGTAPPLSDAGLAAALFDEARGRGDHVRVAWEEDAIVGAVGWVHGPGVMFAAPFIAPRGEVAEALLDALFAEATRRQPAWIRSSTGSLTSPRAAALAGRGFTPQFDFTDYARPTTDSPATLPVGTRVVAHDALERGSLLALYNETFEDVPNTLPMTAPQLDELLDGPLAFAAGTAALVDEDGRYVGFLHAERLTDAAGAHVTVDAVGVAPAWRGRGVGEWLICHLLRAASAAGVPEARALIASTNTASVKLHTRLGFVERFRRHVWEWRRSQVPGPQPDDLPCSSS